MATVIFVAFNARLRKRVSPKRRDVCKRHGLDAAQYAVRDSDIRDFDCPAMKSPGKKIMARLAPEKRNGDLRIDRASHDHAGRTVHATRQIDGYDGCRSGIHQTDGVAGLSLNVAVEPRTEQCVDDHVAFRKRRWRRLACGPAPTLCRQSGVTFQPLAFSNKTDVCRQASISQIARSNEAVAAVVTRARHDHDAATLRHPAGRFGYGAACVLHEFDAGDASSNGQAIGLRHLSRREQFDHLSARVSARPTTDNSGQRIAPKAVLRGWLNSNHFA